jgi:hypothetical protein
MMIELSPCHILGMHPRGFGIEEYYPEVEQFITILRDPFETAISTYYYTRKKAIDWKDRSRIPKTDLRQYLMDTPPNILNHFPRQVTKDNYKELIEKFFIEIGVTERLPESLQRIADKLGMQFNKEWLPQLNLSNRDQEHPHDLYELYVDKYTLEFDVYDYVLSKFWT